MDNGATGSVNLILRYIRATRAPFLLAAATPCLIGMATAHYSGISLDGTVAMLSVAGPVLAQAGANVVNDYYDALNGTDNINEERISPFTGGSRMIQNGLLTTGQTLSFGALLLAAAVAAGLLLLPRVGHELLWFVAAGLFLTWAYSAPPFKLNSRGWGEVCVAVGFGLLIPLGADFVQRREVDWLPLAAGFPFAMLVTNLLYINQFPDLRADAAVGKRHWVVRLGASKARWGYLLMGGLAYGEVALMVGMGVLPLWSLMALLAAPLSFAAAFELLKYAEKPANLEPAIKKTIGAMLATGILLSVGILVS